ncbi:MAG: hypothetical protein AABX93_00900 [Nanoarchaeota archaeon]
MNAHYVEMPVIGGSPYEDPLEHGIERSPEIKFRLKPLGIRHLEEVGISEEEFARQIGRCESIQNLFNEMGLIRSEHYTLVKRYNKEKVAVDFSKHGHNIA